MFGRAHRAQSGHSFRDRLGRWWNGCRFRAFNLNLARWKCWKHCSFLRQGSSYGSAWHDEVRNLGLSVRQQRPRSLTDMFMGSHANALRFGSQL